MSLSTRSLAASLTLACSVIACAETTTTEDLARRHRDAGVHLDAPVTIADAPLRLPDAPPGGTISCYTEGDPTATCTLPTHCCFNNYSSQHDGGCSTSSCVYGTISCDGPEDCASGERCCAHAMRDPDYGTTGYTIACQAAACGIDSLNVEICHPVTGCSNGGTCVTAYGNDNDLPRTLDVCE
jgi:hypothetical protein